MRVEKYKGHPVIALADLRDGQRVLEPSAGSGRIAEGVRAACPGAALDVCEIHYDLREILVMKGFRVVGEDFLELEPGDRPYDRFVMNPPFEQMDDIRHVRRAYELLAPAGRIVAIMGEGAFFRQDRIAVEFRDWLDGRGWDERLPEGSFKESGTGVAARIVVIDKPENEGEPNGPAAEQESPAAPEPVIAPAAAPVQLSLF